MNLFSASPNRPTATVPSPSGGAGLKPGLFSGPLLSPRSAPLYCRRMKQARALGWTASAIAAWRSSIAARSDGATRQSRAAFLQRSGRRGRWRRRPAGASRLHTGYPNILCLLFTRAAAGSRWPSTRRSRAADAAALAEQSRAGPCRAGDGDHRRHARTAGRCHRRCPCRPTQSGAAPALLGARRRGNPAWRQAMVLTLTTHQPTISPQRAPAAGLGDRPAGFADARPPRRQPRPAPTAARERLARGA